MSNTPPIASTSTTTGDVAPANRHALTAVERQRSQLARLLKDPAKPVHLPTAPKEKSLRPAREMMKNVQGSSAGAGSGEFHVYKASRRREYERIKMMEDATAKEQQDAEFERKRKEAEEAAEAKTAKNRAKRQKKKMAKAKGPSDAQDSASSSAVGDKRSLDASGSTPVLKKRRIVNGKELVFRAPGEGSDDENDEKADENMDEGQDAAEPDAALAEAEEAPEPVKVVDVPRVIIHEDD